jgi:hypothetical protein
VLSSCLSQTGGVPYSSVPNELILEYQSASVGDFLLVVFGATQAQARHQVTTDFRTTGAHFSRLLARGGDSNVAWGISGDNPSVKTKQVSLQLVQHIERLLHGCLTKARR